jgi:UDP-glucose 4-epimerase
MTTALLPKDVDLIIHLAANARVHDLVKDPSRAHDNMTMTFNVLEHARRNGIARVMFSSSRETYGNREGDINAEGDVRIDNCPSPYTAAKIADEAMIHAFQRCYGIDFVTFRFSNVYGMYDDSDRVVPLFQRLARANADIPVFGADKVLDFTYIDDTVAGVIQAAERFEVVKNHVYNLAYGEGMRMHDVAVMIRDRLGSQSRVVVGENRTGEVVKHVADITKARAAFGYAPKVSFEEGLTLALAWYAANPEALDNADAHVRAAA